MSKKTDLAKRSSKQVQKHENKQVELAHDLPVYVPVTDIYEDKDNIVIVSEMPGVNEENIDVTLDEDVLTITGKQSISSPEGYEMLHRGYNEGIYRRSFTLLSEIDREKTSAKIKNGILTVILPKAEAAKPKKIKVNVA